MFRPLALYIGLRYTKAHRKNFFMSFISLSSMLGIALGVMVLITVLAVMSGFDEEIHKRFFDMAPEVSVTGIDNEVNNWQELSQKLSKFPGVKAVAPFVGEQVIATSQGQVVPLVLTGINPEAEQNITNLQNKLIAGSFKNLDKFGIILGKAIAQKLGVTIGNKISIMVPKTTVSPAGMMPRFKRFTVTGIFSAGGGFNFDAKLGFIDLRNAQVLLQMPNLVSGLKIKIANIYDAPKLAADINEKYGPLIQASDWTIQFGAFFQAIKLEKTMMFLILMLIIAVAAFNLISSLVMVVNDKQAEIAILRTIGATPKQILSIFIVQGMIVGIVGTILGLFAGLLLASNATEIVNLLQNAFNFKILSANIYFVDYLPSKILPGDILTICGVSLTMSFLATIYPAWSASKTIIAEALTYE